MHRGKLQKELFPDSKGEHQELKDEIKENWIFVSENKTNIFKEITEVVFPLSLIILGCPYK